MVVSLGVMLILAMTLPLAGCAPKAAETVKIGALFPLTGDLSFIGEPFANAATLAVEHINKAGGVLGKEVELVVEDTGTDSKMAVDAAEKLIKIDKVEAIAGPVATFTSMAALDKVVLNKVLMISPSATAPDLTTVADDDFYFRTCPADTLQAAAIGKLAWDKGYKTANAISRNDAYGVGLEEIFSETFEGLGGKVIEKVRYDPKATEFSGYLADVSKEKADVILLNGLMEDGTRMLKKAHGMGITDEFKFLLCEGVQDPGIPQEVGVEVTLGMGGATPYPEMGGTFPEDFEERFGEEAVAYCANVYDNVILIALAIERAGVYDGTTIRDNLRAVANPPGAEVTDVAEALGLIREGNEINYQGAGGEITFDDAGDISMKRARVWEYGPGGEIEIIGEIEVS